MVSPLAAATAPQPIAPAGKRVPKADCPRTSPYLAGQAGLYRGQPLVPRKLTELPPAIGYMAVYREIGGCEAPLTMVEYRNPRRH
jgi:hypothetical protein